MEIYRAILFLKGQQLMAAGAQPASHDLFDAARVPPRIQNVDLTHIPEVYTLRHNRAGDNHTNLFSIPVLGRLDTLDEFLDL